MKLYLPHAGRPVAQQLISAPLFYPLLFWSRGRLVSFMQRSWFVNIFLEVFWPSCGCMDDFSVCITTAPWKNTPILRSWLGIAMLPAGGFMDPRENKQAIKKEYDLDVFSMRRLFFIWHKHKHALWRIIPQWPWPIMLVGAVGQSWQFDSGGPVAIQQLYLPFASLSTTLVVLNEHTTSLSTSSLRAGILIPLLPPPNLLIAPAPLTST